MLLHSLKFFEQLSVSLFASFLLITDFLPLNFQPTCFHFTSETSWMQCFISGVNVSFNTYMYTITDSGMTLSFHLSLKVVLIYNKNKSLRVRQLGLTVSIKNSIMSDDLGCQEFCKQHLFKRLNYCLVKTLISGKPKYFSLCTWSVKDQTEKSHCTDNKIKDLVTYSFCFELQRDMKSSSNKPDLLIFPGASMLIIVVGITGTLAEINFIWKNSCRNMLITSFIIMWPQLELPKC